jgi:hypothetical protein
MNVPDQTFSATPEPRKGFPWGCLIGGCLSILLLAIIAVGVAVYFAFNFYNTQIEKYTSATPAAIPMVEFTEEKIADVEKRVDSFKKSLEPGAQPEELVLTADDINALISKQEELKGHAYITIHDGEITGEISYPTDGIMGAKGRYFNGEVTLSASMEDGVLIVKLEDAKVNGESLPEPFLDGLRNQNLAKDVYKDPENAELLRKFERLTIEDDRIILKPRAVQPSEPANDPEITDAPAAATQ